jgi:hypothetical protein
MKKLTQSEINKLSKQIALQIEFEDLIKFVKQYYPEQAHSIKFSTDSEYNDETYDLVITDVTVTDIKGQELNKRSEIDEKEYNDSFYNVRDVKSNCGDSDGCSSMNIFVDFKYPELYIQE